MNLDTNLELNFTNNDATINIINNIVQTINI